EEKTPNNNVGQVPRPTMSLRWFRFAGWFVRILSHLQIAGIQPTLRFRFGLGFTIRAVKLLRILGAVVIGIRRWHLSTDVGSPFAKHAEQFVALLRLSHGEVL